MTKRPFLIPPAWILGFTQNLQQLLIGQEEEPGEVESLLLQVLIEPSLDQLQQLRGLTETLKDLVHLQD